MNQGKYWMLTCNELSDAYVKVTNEGFGEEINSRVEYAKIALETGESGNIHFQIYICFLAATRFSSVRKMFPGAHIEQRKGNHLEAKNYIGSSEKSGSVLWVAEVGTDKDIPVLAPAQKRKMEERLLVLRDMVDNGATIGLLYEFDFYATITRRAEIERYIEFRKYCKLS